MILAATLFIYRRRRPNEPAGDSVDETPRSTGRTSSTGASVERADNNTYAVLESPSTGISPVSEKQSETNTVSQIQQPSQADSSPIYEMECKHPAVSFCEKGMLITRLIAPVRKWVELPTDFNQQPAKTFINNENCCHNTNIEIDQTQRPHPVYTRGHHTENQQKRFSFTPSIIRSEDRSRHQDFRPSSSSTTSSSSSSSAQSTVIPPLSSSTQQQQESNFDKIPYSSRIVVDKNAWRG